MNSFSKLPAVQKAYAFLKQGLQSKGWQSGQRLPPLQILARKAGVSRNSMWKAIQQAKIELLVTVTPGGYITAGTASDAPSKHQSSGSDSSHDRGTIWEKTRKILEQDMIKGAFGPDRSLPPVKELLGRYGVCFRTMQKILQSLAKDGMVLQNGKRFSLPGIQTGSYHQRIVFITCCGHFAQVSAINQEHNRIVNLFENECRRMGLLIDIIEIDFYDSTESRRAAMKLRCPDSTIGFIYDIWWYVGEEFRRSYIDVLSRLSTFGKPVAILDEVGSFEMPTQLSSNRLLQVYTIESKRAGERMAGYLASLGHQSMAFISTMHHAQWSQDRFNGAKGFISPSDPDIDLYLVSDTESGSRPDGTLALMAASGISDADVRKLITVGRTRPQAKDMEKMWDEFKRNYSLAMAGPHLADPILKKNLAGLAGILKQDFDPEYLKRSSQAIILAAAERAFGLSLQPFFEKALALSEVTAWICANDTTAFEAVSFLREHGIRIPRDVSVTGFDNIPVTALEQRLTTLDFNPMGFVSQMLNFIVRPVKSGGHFQYSKIEIEGIIMERETVGKARRP